MKFVIYSAAYILAETAFVFWTLTTGSVGGGNLIKFLAALSPFAAAIFVLMALEATSKDARPKWLQLLISYGELAQIAALAWHGWYWCAGAFAASALAGALYRARDGMGPMAKRLKAKKSA